MNFTAQYLTFRRKKILDEIGKDLPGIDYSNEKINFRYNSPYISYNVLKDEKDEEGIVIIDDINMIKKVEGLGFVVCSILIGKREGWYKRQRTMIKLFKRNDSARLKFRRLKIMHKSVIGDKAYMEYDTINERVRLVGIRAGPDGFGPWENIK